MELLTLKSMLFLFGGGGNLYNLDDMESEMIFYKTIKKIFPTYSVLDKSGYHLIVAISVELPIWFCLPFGKYDAVPPLDRVVSG